MNLARIDVAAGERDIVRLFAIDLTRDEAAAMATPEADWSLHMALGAPDLDYGYVDLVDPEDLDGIGLSGFLTEGIGLDPALLAGDRAMLDGLTGPHAVISSPAFRGEALVLTPTNPVRWIATYAPEPEVKSMDPLRSEAAEGEVTLSPPKRPSDAAMSGRIALLALLVLAALTILIVVIA